MLLMGPPCYEEGVQHLFEASQLSNYEQVINEFEVKAKDEQDEDRNGDEDMQDNVELKDAVDSGINAWIDTFQVRKTLFRLAC